MNAHGASTTCSQPSLARALGPWTATAIVIGIVIGSGIFKKPQVVAEHVPSFGLVALVWVLGGLLALLGALATAEVAVQYPLAGGNYVFLREGFGRWAGFLWGWIEFWMIRAASLAALATIFTDTLWSLLVSQAINPSEHMTFWLRTGTTVGVIMVLALVNARGIRWGGLLQLVITSVKIASLCGIALLPLVLALRGTHQAFPMTTNLQPFWPDEWRSVSLDGLGIALVSVLWAYHGWMSIAPVAGEIDRPQRNIPLALVLGTCVVILLYLNANVAYSLVLSREEMKSVHDGTVAEAFGNRLLGPIGLSLISGAVMTSVFGALNGNLLAGPRVLYAMGEDGLAPRALAGVHPRYQTPTRAILLMAGWASTLVLLGAVLTRYQPLRFAWGESILDLNVPRGKSLFDVLTDLAIFGSVTFETLAVSTIFVFRWRNPERPRSYGCPGYPMVPLLYVTIMGLVLVGMVRNQRTEVVGGVLFTLLGLAVYPLMERHSLSSKNEL